MNGLRPRIEKAATFDLYSIDPASHGNIGDDAFKNAPRERWKELREKYPENFRRKFEWTGNGYRPRKTFHDWAILGRTKIGMGALRTELVESLYRSIETSTGFSEFCFFPRHGIRAGTGRENVDVVICFECSRMRVYSRWGDSSITLGGDAAASFDRVLRNAGITVDDPHGRRRSLSSK